jgi:hypothetical protein
MTTKGLGFIVEMGEGFIVETHRGKLPIDKILGKAIKAHDAQPTPTGRPRIFQESSEMRGITLPKRLWKLIGEPASANIASMIEEVCQKR